MSSWGTGSTAVTGYMDKLGAYSCPPHFHTNDEKTPNSFEPLELRNLLNGYISELDFKVKKDSKLFEKPFSTWIKNQNKIAYENKHTHLVLKHPLLIFFLPTILKYCDASIIYVIRNLDSVERTRNRRGWPANLGREGAMKIHNIIYDLSFKLQKPILQLPYESFISNNKSRLELINFTGLRPSKAQIMKAESWIKK